MIVTLHIQWPLSRQDNDLLTRCVSTDPVQVGVEAVYLRLLFLQDVVEVIDLLLLGSCKQKYSLLSALLPVGLTKIALFYYDPNPLYIYHDIIQTNHLVQSSRFPPRMSDLDQSVPIIAIFHGHWLIRSWLVRSKVIFGKRSVYPMHPLTDDTF